MKSWLLSFILLLTSPTLFAGAGSSIERGGQVWHFKLDEGSGTRASNSIKGKANVGTLQGGAVWVPGKFGSSVYFPSDGSYISFDPTGLPTGSQSHLFTAWVYTDNIMVGGGILLRFGGGGGVYQLRANGGPGGCGDLLMQGSPGLNFDPVNVKIATKTWCFFANWFTGGNPGTDTMYVFYGGQLQSKASSVATGINLTAGALLEMGATSLNTADRFQGRIDEPSLWLGTIDEGFIKHLYTVGMDKYDRNDE